MKSRRIRWAGNVVIMEEDWRVFKILTSKSTGNILLRRPRRRWEDNIRMDLKEISINKRFWFDSVEDRYYCWILLLHSDYMPRSPKWPNLYNFLYTNHAILCTS